MTTTLYQRKDWKGKSLDISRNWRSLKESDLGNHPSSIMMTEPEDAILMFNKEDWKGGVLYFRGVRKMASLGDLSAGGELFKGDSVTSVRVTPFTVALNVTVVTRDGAMPGDNDDRDAVEIDVTKAMLIANAFFEREKAMLAMEVGRFSFRDDPERYDLGKLEAADFPNDWTRAGEIDLVICNTLKGAYGQAKLPWWGKTMVVALRGGDDTPRTLSELARTLAHELGHFLGLAHRTGDGAAVNIMTPSVRGLPIEESTMEPDQIEEMQTKLARNLTRKGNRNE